MHTVSVRRSAGRATVATKGRSSGSRTIRRAGTVRQERNRSRRQEGHRREPFLSNSLTTARFDLACGRRAVLSKPLLAHPAELRGVHAAWHSHPRNADDRDQPGDNADDKQHMALGAARSPRPTAILTHGREAVCALLHKGSYSAAGCAGTSGGRRLGVTVHVARERLPASGLTRIEASSHLTQLQFGPLWRLALFRSAHDTLTDRRQRCHEAARKPHTRAIIRRRPEWACLLQPALELLRR